MAAKEGADGKPQLTAHCRASGPESLAGLPVQPLSAPRGSQQHSSHSGTLIWDPTGGRQRLLGTVNTGQPGNWLEGSRPGI